MVILSIIICCSVLENYAKWHFLYAIMPFMSEEFSELSRTFDRIFQPGMVKEDEVETWIFALLM